VNFRVRSDRWYNITMVIRVWSVKPHETARTGRAGGGVSMRFYSICLLVVRYKENLLNVLNILQNLFYLNNTIKHLFQSRIRRPAGSAS
jgi:hypothetical protein